MKINQLSIFLENKPGHLACPVGMLADAGINILTLTLADSQRFGILRLIVKEWEKARQLLEEHSLVVKVTEVLAIEVADRPGGLKELLYILVNAGVNVEYMYAFSGRTSGKAVMVLRMDDTEKAIQALQTAGVNVLNGGDLCQLAAQ